VILLKEKRFWRVIMAWSDEPTEAQLGTIYSWFKWEMSNEKAAAAIEYLENTATRRDVSFEMRRLKNLKEKRLLDASKCFESEIWERFDYDERG